MLSARNVVLTGLFFGSITAIVIACGSEGDQSKFVEPPPNVGFGDGSFADTGKNPNDPYKNDPLPKYCGPEGGAPPPQVGGTEECPDDKNKPGCGCAVVGETAPCWTGLRKHRNLGQCKDGVATCINKNEVTKVWGECVGEVLPTINATTGKAQCSCFSIGQWEIDNTAPCNWTRDGVNYYSYSTVLGPADGGREEVTNCSKAFQLGPDDTPSAPWSKNRLTVDCGGDFRLQFRIRAGDINNPKPDDCILGEVEVQTGFVPAKVKTELPVLPAWKGKDGKCAEKWEKTPADVSPGYGEMIVKGQTVECNAIDDGNGGDLVFHRVEYCPTVCRGGSFPFDPPFPAEHKDKCSRCTFSGKGDFTE